MKLILSIILSLLFALPAYAHRGGLDAYGCHNNRKAEIYQCHKGGFKDQAFANKAAMIAAKEGEQSTSGQESSPLKPEIFKAKVIAVIDGDTIEVLHKGKVIRIRLADIDAPEMAQPYGPEARQYVIDQAMGKVVTIKAQGSGTFGRMIASILLPNSASLNRELIKAGLARWYKKYSTDISLSTLEERAKKQELGLWRRKNRH